MKVTENDTTHPEFWKLQRRAEGTVEAVLGRIIADPDLTEKEAKAFSDAVEAVTKLLVLTTPRERPAA